jgi:hypothetical protein
MVVTETPGAESPPDTQQDAPRSHEDAFRAVDTFKQITAETGAQSRRKRIETSKLILFGWLIFCAVLACLIVYGWFSGLSGAQVMLGEVLAAAGMSIGFYTWKSKAEQLHKNAKGVDMTALAGLPVESQKMVLEIVAKEQIQTGNGNYNSYGGYSTNYDGY